MQLTVRVYEEDPSKEWQHQQQHYDQQPLDENLLYVNVKGAVASAQYTYTLEENGENYHGMDFSVSSNTSKPVFIETRRQSVQSSSSTTLNVMSMSSPPMVLDRLRRILTQLFLPIGYPHSVDPTYFPYQLYDSLQGLCSYLRGVVSTSAVLQASGVGDATASAMSAALAWAIRDGIGMVGGLVFSYVASDSFDIHVKEFRLFADIINDVGLTLDMLAPHFATVSTTIQWPMYILCLSTFCKVMCGMSAGATKGRITQHFAVRGNMADLTAKESTQETLVSLLGMIGGIGLARTLSRFSATRQEKNGQGDGNEDGTSNVSRFVLSTDQELWITWGIFGVLTLIHVWANYKGVMLLRLKTINRERGMEALKGVVSTMAKLVVEEQHHGSTNDVDHDEDQSLVLLEQALQDIPSPHQISESMASSVWNMMFPTIDLRRNFDPQDYQESLAVPGLFAEERYLIGQSRSRTSSVTPTNGRNGHPRRPVASAIPVICVSLCVGATLQDELQAWVHAVLLETCLAQGLTWNVTLLQRYARKVFGPAIVVHTFFLTDPRPCLMRCIAMVAFLRPPAIFSLVQNLTTRTHQQVLSIFQKSSSPSLNLMKRLEQQGWDVQNRLYLGYFIQRIQWSSGTKGD
jgi:Vitamin B6 photo-protection and homoeostasis